MAEMLISSGFYAFAGFGLRCDLRETITIPARHRGIRPSSRAERAIRHCSAREERKRPRRTGYAAATLSWARRNRDAVAKHDERRWRLAGHDRRGARAPWMTRSKFGVGEIESARRRMHRLWERGRRRTRQDQISRWAWRPGEIAELEEIRTERRKPVSSAGPVSDRAPELFERSIQPFDLMSRRHPLSSTRAAYLKSASGSRPSWRLV